MIALAPRIIVCIVIFILSIRYCAADEYEFSKDDVRSVLRYLPSEYPLAAIINIKQMRNSAFARDYTWGLRSLSRTIKLNQFCDLGDIDFIAAAYPHVPLADVSGEVYVFAGQLRADEVRAALGKQGRIVSSIIGIPIYEVAAEPLRFLGFKIGSDREYYAVVDGQIISCTDLMVIRQILRKANVELTGVCLKLSEVITANDSCLVVIEPEGYRQLPFPTKDLMNIQHILGRIRVEKDIQINAHVSSKDLEDAIMRERALATIPSHISDLVKPFIDSDAPGILAMDILHGAKTIRRGTDVDVSIAVSRWQLLGMIEGRELGLRDRNGDTTTVLQNAESIGIELHVVKDQEFTHVWSINIDRQGHLVFPGNLTESPFQVSNVDHNEFESEEVLRAFFDDNERPTNEPRGYHRFKLEDTDPIRKKPLFFDTQGRKVDTSVMIVDVSEKLKRVGLKDGDIVRSYAGQDIDYARTFKTLWELLSDTENEIIVQRRGKQIKLRIPPNTFGFRPVDFAKARERQ